MSNTAKATIQDVMSTVQDIKDFLQDNVMTALRDHDRQFEAIREEIQDFREEFLELKGEFSNLQGEVSTLRDQVSTLRDEVSTLKDEFLSFKDWTVMHVTSLEEEVSMIVVRLDEVREKLECFDPKEYSELKQEMAQLRVRIARLEEIVKKP